MKDVLDRLVELQKLDQQLHQLKALRGDLPNQVQMLQQDVNQAKKNLQDQKDKLQTYRKEKDMLELEIKDLESKQKKYHDQLYQVKNNREYDAVSMEIENVKETISNKETRIIELITLDEDLEKSIQSTQNEVQEIQGQLDQKENDLKKRLGQTEVEEKKLQTERSKIASDLPPRIVSMYQRIFNAKNKIAVVPVLGHGVCGGCFKNLPPQRVLEIREMKRMNLCEVCGRILVWDEEAADKKP
ncbi:hypothetical protein JW948_07250 [bacterium]|nr:hypothetical protein [bacterium]